MKKRFKQYFKLNLLSMFLIAVSFISVTLAWFAYSGIAKVTTEVNVKAWNIELEKSGEKVSNDIVISLSEIYPGMDIVYELLKIRNLGDSDANVKYEISSARILDEYNYDLHSSSSNETEDELSYEFPFGINMSLSKNYAKSKGDESYFQISVLWPLDSGDDELDSYWGTKAYEFQQNEEAKRKQDPDYQTKPSIQIVISLTAEQYIEEATSTDTRYDLGKEILYDVYSDKRCYAISATCIKTHVIDINNTLGQTEVNLLPTPLNSYIDSTYYAYDQTLFNLTQDWQVKYRPLDIKDILKILAKDVRTTNLIRNGISSSLIGNFKTEERMNKELTKTSYSKGYYQFNNKYFDYLSSVDCYWSTNEYNLNQAFAVKKIDSHHSKVYGEDKNQTCKVMPILQVSKEKL